MAKYVTPKTTPFERIRLTRLFYSSDHTENAKGTHPLSALLPSMLNEATGLDWSEEGQGQDY
jgi:hypothetical protein